MGRHFYKNFFPGRVWEKFAKKVNQDLKRESVLLTALPDVGITFFIKYIEETQTTLTKNSKCLIIFFDVIPEQTKISHIASKISEIINFKLNFPKYLEDIGCQETLNELIKRNYEVIIIINRFERLKNNPETLAFLNSLRGINPVKIRFLISCGIDCLTEQQKFTPSGMLTSANVKILPCFDLDSTSKLLLTYKKVYKWRVPRQFARQIYSLSGGYAGFIKYISKFLHENKPKAQISNKLIEDPALNFKIQNLIQILENNGLLQKTQLNLSKAPLLQKLGVIDKKNTLRIKLLKPFLRKKEQILNKRDLYKLLSPQELSLFELFQKNFKKIVLLDEISEHLWKDKAYKKYSLWSIYKIVENIRKKVKPFGFYIENYRDRGYALTKLNK